MADFNLALVNLRKEKNMSQEHLARSIGFTRQYVARVESGESEGKRAFWLAIQRVFDVPDDKMWKLYKGESLE